MKVTDLTYLEISKRVVLLHSFHKQVVIYYSNLIDGYDFDKVREKPEAQAARREINKISQKAISYIEDTGVPTCVNYYPAPAVGGFERNIDLLYNIFNLKQSSIPPQKIVDIIEQALGVYELDFKSSIVRTFNPFFWIMKIFRAIGAIPFTILESAGLHVKKFEDSIWGKVIKILTSLLGFLTALYGFLKAIGKETLITHFFK